MLALFSQLKMIWLMKVVLWTFGLGKLDCLNTDLEQVQTFLSLEVVVKDYLVVEDHLE